MTKEECIKMMQDKGYHALKDNRWCFPHEYVCSFDEYAPPVFKLHKYPDGYGIKRFNFIFGAKHPEGFRVQPESL